MRTERLGKILLIAVPWLILTGMIAGAYLPIYRGTKYLLPVKPRDPRDFFRGNYVDLQYEFSNLARAGIRVGLDAQKTYRFGDTLYLDLVQKENSLKAAGLYDKADKGKNVRLKVHPRWLFDETYQSFDLVAGLESFFAPKTAAEDWERALREGKVFAEVAIDSGGNARLIQLKKAD